MKSPIKENNKFRAGVELKRMIPKGSVVDTFLFFGGEVEFQLAAADRFIVAHTHKYVIYEFWQCALRDAHRIADISKSLFPIDDPNTFYILQENWPKYPDPYTRSALFFLLNRCSTTGEISAGQLSEHNFNPLALSHLKNFNPKNFYITFDQTEDLIDNIKKAERGEYLLLPIGDFNYNFFEQGKNKGYEMSTIHHRPLHEALEESKKKWIILYRPHPQLEKMYADYNIKMINRHGHLTTKHDECTEVLIANF